MVQNNSRIKLGEIGWKARPLDKKTNNSILTNTAAFKLVSLVPEFQLNEEKGVNATSFSSPLNTIMERYANFEKTIGHMLAANEMEIARSMSVPFCL